METNQDTRENPDSILQGKYVLKLYVAGGSSILNQAITAIKKICDEELKGAYQLVIIDVLEKPQLAEDEKILATPTLIKQLPSPLRRIVGDLSNRERVLIGLDLHKRA